MSLDTGFYPSQAELILTPTGYTSGGTSLGKVQSVHTATIASQFEFLTEHVAGSTVVDARMTGVDVTYLIHLIDVSVALLGVLFNHTNTSDKWQGYTGYNVGDILSSSQTSALLVRPLDDDGATDSSKPFLYMPRAMCVSAFNATWDRRVPHTSGWVLQVTALYSSAITAPALYGDVADFPAL